MATSHYKIRVKDLKQPDEFITTVDRIGNYLVNNLARVIIGAVALVAVTAVIFGYSFYRSHQDRVAADHFYEALTALNHKDYKTAEEGFEALAQSGSGKLARLAPLYLASAYLAENKAAQARDALESYIAGSNHNEFKNLALVQLGVADENLGDFKKAHDAYAQAADIAGPAKASAQLGVARMLLKTGDKTGAITAWRNFLAENPFSPERTDVVASLAALGAAPSNPTAALGAAPFDTTPARSRPTTAAKLPVSR
jgi:predicted negative regulator of RcsB-dependent stress response